MKELHLDPRFRRLSSRAARALTTALTTFGDADGSWFVKHETLAECVGVDGRTIARAVNEWVNIGKADVDDPAKPLVAVKRWMRPPGSAGGPQGANTYELDPAVIARALTRLDSPVNPSRDDNSDMASSRDSGVTATRHDNSVEPERVSNELINEQRAKALGKNWKHLNPDDLEHDIRAEFWGESGLEVGRLVRVALEGRWGSNG